MEKYRNLPYMVQPPSAMDRMQGEGGVVESYEAPVERNTLGQIEQGRPMDHFGMSA